jgi:hypothetical protein
MKGDLGAVYCESQGLNRGALVYNQFAALSVPLTADAYFIRESQLEFR